MTRKKIIKVVCAIIMWFLSLIVLVPLAIILINSVKTQGEAVRMQLTWPTIFKWGNYEEVARTTKLFQSFVNSLVVSISTTILSIVGSSMGAFVMARRRSSLSKGLYLYFLFGLVAPLNMVPCVLVMQKLHLINSRPGLVLLYVALVTPFTMFLYYGFFDTIPREMDEAAIIDGCKPYQMFVRVIFPLLKPVTVTAGILNFMNSWNDFLTPFYIMNNSLKMPMTTMIYTLYGQYQRSWHLVSAMMVMIIAPVIIVYLSGQKYIISGMTAGAVKG